MPTICRSHGPSTDGQIKPRNSTANGRKDAPITQTHMPSFTKPLGYDRTIAPPIITPEDVTPQPKEEMPWMSTQL
jgi:hypothetical protein